MSVQADSMEKPETLSPWWRQGAILVLIIGFSVLIWLTVRVYQDAPPIPEKVIGPTGEVLFTQADILAGQQVFLKYALMENGTIWGHGAYLGPDFSAEYLHTLSEDADQLVAHEIYGRPWDKLTLGEQSAVKVHVQQLLKENRYDPKTRVLHFTSVETASFERQVAKWGTYFFSPTTSGGLPAHYISDTQELRSLTAFFAWTAWASVARRPDKPYSYTNNFPYDPTVGNTPPSAAILWSALSLIALLGGTAAVLFAFGRFDFLG